MKWISNRISFKDHKQEGYTTFIISPKVERWKESLLLGWLIIWTLIGGVLIYLLLNQEVLTEINPNYTDKERKLYLIIFLSFWLFFEYKIARVFLWRKMGFEYIKLTKDELVLKKAIGKYGKAESFLKQNIKDLEIGIKKDNGFAQVMTGAFWDVGQETIFFSYLNKRIGIGRQLSLSEAKQLKSTLQGKLKQKL